MSPSFTGTVRLINSIIQTLVIVGWILVTADHFVRALYCHCSLSAWCTVEILWFMAGDRNCQPKQSQKDETAIRSITSLSSITHLQASDNLWTNLICDAFYQTTMPHYFFFIYVFLNQSRMIMMFTRVFILTKLMTMLVLLQFGRYDCAHHDDESLIFFFF